MIKVLIVEDSPVVRDLLIYVMSVDPEFHVVGTAADGVEACQAVPLLRPDIVTMDIHMPRMNGFEATRRIMETCPVPIVIVSGSVQADEVATTFHALEAGALSALPRPTGIDHADFAATANAFINTIRLMAEIKVVRRWPEVRKADADGECAPALTINTVTNHIRLIAIGASTGGPPAIHAILNELPEGFPVPVIIVQHMMPEFIPGFAEWLHQTTRLDVRLASDGAMPRPAEVYIAPGNYQTGFSPGGRIVLRRDPPENGHRPSVSYLFRAVVEVFGNEAVGVLLTGMGNDGAAELRIMREKGAVTIAQNETTCAVFGMPGEAVKLQAAAYVLPPKQIAAVLLQIVNPVRTERT